MNDKTEAQYALEVVYADIENRDQWNTEDEDNWINILKNIDTAIKYIKKGQ